MINLRPTRSDAYQLLHEGAEAFATIEEAGIRVDTDRMRAAQDALALQRRGIEDRLDATDLVKRGRARYGKGWDLESPEKLGAVLYKDMGLKPVRMTDTGKPGVDEDSLKALGLPEVDLVLEWRGVNKTRETFLAGIAREVVDGYLHPFFNLHTVRTFRSSSNDPNFQNMPIRDPEAGRWIRSCITARPGRQLVEFDFSGQEVRVAACYHRDPNMLKYLRDPTKDMHRDQAMACYKLPQPEVTKGIRYAGKNGFVFPEFYGSYWKQVAPDLWAMAAKYTTTSGVPLRTHLERVGIRELGRLVLGPNGKIRGTSPQGCFYDHIKAVEKHFWGTKFRVYDQWRRDWYAQYLKQGYFDTLSGFRCAGVMGRNDAINYPVQGTAFHTTLWTLIQLIREMEERRMESLVVGQIHDSIVGDIVPEERDDYIALAMDIVNRRLPEHWPWIIVPMDAEVEVAPVDGSWFDKKKWAPV